MALAAVRSKAVVLNSVVDSVFIASPDVCGGRWGCVWSLFCSMVPCILSVLCGSS